MSWDEPDLDRLLEQGDLERKRRRENADPHTQPEVAPASSFPPSSYPEEGNEVIEEASKVGRVEAVICKCGHDENVHRLADQAGRPCWHPDRSCLCPRFRPASTTAADAASKKDADV